MDWAPAPGTRLRLGLAPRCPDSVSALGRSCDVYVGDFDPIGETGVFIHLQFVISGRRIANRKCDLQLSIRGIGWAMLGELMNIPTDTLIDMLYIILADDFSITVNNVAEIEQIQRELQRRGGELCWSLQPVN